MTRQTDHGGHVVSTLHRSAPSTVSLLEVSVRVIRFVAYSHALLIDTFQRCYCCCCLFVLEVSCADYCAPITVTMKCEEER